MLAIRKFLGFQHPRSDMENPLKVQQKLNELNRGLPSPQWIAGTGLHAMVTFEFGATSANATFNSSQGYPVKIFVNVASGEVKTFSGWLFKD